jgi:hypothetical protein
MVLPSSAFLPTPSLFPTPQQCLPSPSLHPLPLNPLLPALLAPCLPSVGFLIQMSHEGILSLEKRKEKEKREGRKRKRKEVIGMSRIAGVRKNRKQNGKTVKKRN